MSRTSTWNRNYTSATKMPKGVMLTIDAMQIVVKYQTLMLNQDVQNSVKLNVIRMFTDIMNDVMRTDKRYDMAYARMRVNSFMADNEFAPEHALSLVCTFIEDMLFKADNYSGFNNFKWSNGGSNAWHDAHPNKYASDEAHKIAQDAIPSFSSQEYHRIYY